MFATRVLELQKAFSDFWKSYPALLYGIHFALGSGLALSFNVALLLVPLLLWGPILSIKSQLTLFLRRKCTQALTLTLIAWAYTHLIYPPCTITTTPLKGAAYVEIFSVKLHHTPFKAILIYKGRLKVFSSPPHKPIYNLPCHIQLPLDASRPLANKDYLIQGSLLEKSPGKYSFKPTRNLPWKPVKNTFSFAEWRYRNKNRVATYIEKHISHPPSAKLLSALITGELDEPMLAWSFQRLGLQHILAISGFHFALIAAFLGVVFYRILPYKASLWTLFTLLTLYFFFLGSSPSIARAWIALSVFLLGKIFGLRSTALNALGLGLLIEVIGDPSIITHLGFQLTFLSTAAILILYPFCHRLFCKLLPRRSALNLLMMPSLHQHGYLLSAIVRKALSLNLAVHLLTIPILLCVFHRFPLLSIIYNLFFPFAISLSLTLLLFSFVCSFLPLLKFLAPYLHHTNSIFTSHLLGLINHPPASYEFIIRVGEFPFVIVAVWICGLFLLAIWGNSRTKIS